MPQMQLPLFPEGSQQISNHLAFENRDGTVTYFHGGLPVFTHDEHDRPTFRMITAQLCEQGHAKQSEIARVFGVPLISVKRAVKLFREEGTGGFYKARKTRGAAVLTKPALEEVQAMLDADIQIADIAGRLGLKRDTLNKAVLAGRLHKAKKKRPTGKEKTIQ